MSDEHTIPNQELAEAMEGLGFSIKRRKRGSYNFFDVNMSMSGIRKYMEAQKRGKLPGHLNLGPKEYIWGNEQNSSFVGGTAHDLVEQLNGKLDMGPLLKEREKFAKAGLAQKLQTKIAELNPRRRRFLSEHDGEWSYDRRWEITPFQATTKMPSPGKTLEIICFSDFSGYASAEDINRYGAMAWAISDLIEQAGISTRIEAWYGAQNVGQGVDGEIHLEVKKAGQYIGPSALASTFQAVFFRRAMFSVMASIAHLDGKPHSSGLGQALQAPHRIKFEAGRLIISPMVHVATNDEIEREILAAIAKERAS